MYFRGGHGFVAIGCEIEGPPLRVFLTPSLSPSLLLGLWTALKLGVVVGGGGGWWWWVVVVVVLKGPLVFYFGPNLKLRFWPRPKLNSKNNSGCASSGWVQSMRLFSF